MDSWWCVCVEQVFVCCRHQFSLPSVIDYISRYPSSALLVQRTADGWGNGKGLNEGGQNLIQGLKVKGLSLTLSLLKSPLSIRYHTCEWKPIFNIHIREIIHTGVWVSENSMNKDNNTTMCAKLSKENILTRREWGNIGLFLCTSPQSFIIRLSYSLA